MTLSSTTALDARDLEHLDDPQRELRAVVFGPETKMTDEPRRLDIADIARAVVGLDPSRVQPKYDGTCKYAEPKTMVPSCLVGNIIAKLAPAYFATIADVSGSVSGLSGIYSVFTERAVLLLKAMQVRADGVAPFEQHAWGDAIVGGAFDRLIMDRSDWSY